MKKPFITIERRERPVRAESTRPWLFPLIVGVAIAVLVGVTIYSLATGVFFP